MRLKNIEEDDPDKQKLEELAKSKTFNFKELTAKYEKEQFRKDKLDNKFDVRLSLVRNEEEESDAKYDAFNFS